MNQVRRGLKDVAGAAHERRTQAHVMAATMIVDGALARYEVLSSDELPAMMGEETYSRPLARMRGELRASGVTYSDD
ncbi:hypothetical protein [Sphingomonas sp. BK069]|uniref:hypothetical protein n=1 Tax=Sphingomonas sp. BK069 TaxID=2586979 RepID=UPI0016183B69|nr:hypothetical protein [Sphingomonas sp. BK069]MBB3349195.1 hypothetical protein [Sphingomonas sp. BK069]